MSVLKRKPVQAGIAALGSLGLVFAGVGIASAVTTSSVAAPSNLYGCVVGSARTLEHVYTDEQNFINNDGCTKVDGFPITINSAGQETPVPTPTPTKPSPTPTKPSPTPTAPSPSPTATKPAPSPSPTPTKPSPSPTPTTPSPSPTATKPVTTTAARTNCITIAGDGTAVSTANLTAAESATGTTFNCLNTFANPADTWADWENPWQFAGNTSWTSWLDSNPKNQVILGMDLVPWSATGTTVAPVANPLTWEQEGAAGDFDSDATQLAENLVSDGAFANGQPLTIRLGIEANGNWEADWVGGTATEEADWAKTYDNEVAAMRAVPGTNFKFVWNPNACFSVDTGALSTWYPGNNFVDIIGADLYDSDCTNTDSAATEGFSALASDGSPSLNSIVSFANANGKPLAFGEWGLEQGDDPAYVNGIGDTVNSDNFAYQAYFDDGDGAEELNSSVPQSVAAYKEQFG
jgi:beta-mannanase